MCDRITSAIKAALIGALLAGWSVRADEPFYRWIGWWDMGATIPEDAPLTELFGPVSGETMELSAGFQMDFGVGYRVTEWLAVGPELGFTINGVHSLGDWSYPNTLLGQFLMMANVRLEYPPESRIAPFVGGGIGGSATFLTFYGTEDDAYDYPDGAGADIALAFQGFAGIRIRLSDEVNLGVVYRYLTTNPQEWEVGWHNGGDFDVGVDSIRMHSICLILSGRF